MGPWADAFPIIALFWDWTGLSVGGMDSVQLTAMHARTEYRICDLRKATGRGHMMGTTGRGRERGRRAASACSSKPIFRPDALPPSRYPTRPRDSRRPTCRGRLIKGASGGSRCLAKGCGWSLGMLELGTLNRWNRNVCSSDPSVVTNEAGVTKTPRLWVLGMASHGIAWHMASHAAPVPNTTAVVLSICQATIRSTLRDRWPKRRNKVPVSPRLSAAVQALQRNTMWGADEIICMGHERLQVPGSSLPPAHHLHIKKSSTTIRWVPWIVTATSSMLTNSFGEAAIPVFQRCIKASKRVAKRVA
ncbi:hypothetical protein E4U43_001763 [Claviceps pusilla]|uniref:Uncharacterized protein n=1 Tax=Claviceps pusilla TaxID=123648 RepID=A0A9P7N795_9HYPO|nr:hypothetical protein E4U43_001763 [Claviceps pusilla]